MNEADEMYQEMMERIRESIGASFMLQLDEVVGWRMAIEIDRAFAAEDESQS